MNKKKKRLMGAIMTLALMAQTVVSVSGAPVSQAKKGISLKKSKVVLTEGATDKIIVKNAPKGASVTFLSKDKAVATVTKKGVVKAKGKGATKIIVKVSKKKKLLKKLTCRVKVEAKNTKSPEPTFSPVVSEKFVGDKNAKLSDDFIAQMDDFSVKLFNACGLADVKADKNVLISPQSVITDMMMAANGAATTTLEEMEKVMCGGVGGFTQFRKSLADMNAQMIYSSKVKFHTANSVWIRDDAERIQVKPEFLEDSEKWYNAGSYVVPFDNTMVKKVNDWVNENTLGMIPELLKDAPKEEEVMHLINALAFDGAWEEQYEDFRTGENQLFTNSKGEKEKVTMLYEMMGSYMHDDKAVAFSKPYKGYDFSFVAILPNEGVSVADYLAGLDGKALKNLMDSTEYDCDVNTELPEFKYDYDVKMGDGIQSMGIKKAFASDADFSAMADTKTGKLFIGEVMHKTHIELDKNGTKAAAVTDIIMKDTTSVEPQPKKVVNIYLDRPFIYAIVHEKTGIPVFLGVVNSVNPQ